VIYTITVYKVEFVTFGIH